jgi:hypothetical protein
MGLFLSVSAYAVVQAGLLGITFEASSGTDPGLYAYAGFLVGMCCDVVMGKAHQDRPNCLRQNYIPASPETLARAVKYQGRLKH